MNWIYKLYGESWEPWLGKDAMTKFLTGGYYSKLFPISKEKSLKIIVINTNYCSRENFWQLYNPVDPGNQLQWLVAELADAEKKGNIVHIVGHAPVTSDACTQTWAHNYLTIINRFKDTIKTSFFGHTHRDELRIYFAPKTGNSVINPEINPDKSENSEELDPILVGFVGGSITTFGYVDPCYKVYEMSDEVRKTRFVLDLF